MPAAPYTLTTFPSEVTATDPSAIPQSDIENDYNKMLRGLKELKAIINGANAGNDANGNALQNYTGNGLTDRLEAIEIDGKLITNTTLQQAYSVGSAGDRKIRQYLGNTSTYVELMWDNAGGYYKLQNQAATLKNLRVATPSNTSDAATKGYVDTVADAIVGTYLNFYYVTSGTSWTVPAGISYIELWLIGAGAGSGGAPNTATPGGGGGGSGGVIWIPKIPVADLGSAVTYALGAAGTAGTSAANGGNGGNTTFITSAGTLTAGGGIGGAFGGSANGATGGDGGSCTNGFALYGGLDLHGNPGNTSAEGGRGSGQGGNTPMGFGAGGKAYARSDGLNDGMAGRGLGAGAGGGCSTNAGVAAGAVGAAGGFLIKTYG